MHSFKKALAAQAKHLKITTKKNECAPSFSFEGTVPGNEELSVRNAFPQIAEQLNFFVNSSEKEEESNETPETQATPNEVPITEHATIRRKSDGSSTQGIDTLIARVSFIEQQCAPNTLEEEIEQKDPFLEMKTEMYRLVQKVRGTLRGREKEVQLHGNSVSAIKMKFDLDKKINALQSMKSTLKSIFVIQARYYYNPKLRKPKNYYDPELTDSEIESRQRDVEMLHRIIDEIVESNNRSRAAPDSNPESEQRFLQFLPDSPNTTKSKRPLTKEERMYIQKWEERDKQIDIELEGLNQSLEGLESIAIQIGEKASVQTEAALNLEEKTEETSGKMTEIQIQLRAAIAKQNESRFWGRLGLFFLLICLIGAIGGIISKKPIGEKLSDVITS
eukprot:GHVP01049748.1.p1 GENE.GHVP01049748.1~~GHVP01049748.1.p1  ORF type:complete len:398 (-),score=92.26 GHVP01049748.1:79-1248(-)